MKRQKELFQLNKMYDHTDSDRVFLQAVIENVQFHQKHCKKYADILKHCNFSCDKLETIQDLYRLPPIPTLYLKHNKLQSLPDKKLLVKATSSGTSGAKSYVGYDWNTLYLGSMMVRRMANFHKLWAIRPTNHIILGYEPSSKNQTIISKTAYGASWFAPALHREYALKMKEGSYQVDFRGIRTRLLIYSRNVFPVRIIGFPSYLYFMLQEMKKHNIKVTLPKHSMILLGGGWKQFTGQMVDKETLYEMVWDRLGIPKENCREFFGVAEHPIVYCDCKHHHYHVPVYSRVIIRDIRTLEPVPNGTPGILNLITPLFHSVPFVSIMTDDLAVLHDGKECGCGISAPYFETLGRVGIQGVKTCTAGANEKCNKERSFH